MPADLYRGKVPHIETGREMKQIQKIMLEVGDDPQCLVEQYELTSALMAICQSDPRAQELIAEDTMILINKLRKRPAFQILRRGGQPSTLQPVPPDEPQSGWGEPEL